MFWWCKAAAEVAQGRCKRFGFITTNSIHQTFNRRVIEPFVAAVSNRQAQLHLAYAIPDHPWIDSAAGTAVRIAMTVADPGKGEGILEKVTAERLMEHGECEVTLLKQIHDELDAAVLEAYGWSDLSRSVGVSPTSGDKEGGRDAHAPCGALLTRLVALNHERAAEEKRGHIRWLRPDYQCGGDHRSPQQSALPCTESASSQSKIPNQQSSIGNPSSPWPAKLPAQVTLIRQLLATDPAANPEQLSACFGRKNPKRTEQIEGILETLKGLGQLLILNAVTNRGHHSLNQHGIDLIQICQYLMRVAESTGLQQCPRCGRRTTCLYGPEKPYEVKGRCRWCLDADGPVMTVTVDVGEIIEQCLKTKMEP